MGQKSRNEDRIAAVVKGGLGCTLPDHHTLLTEPLAVQSANDRASQANIQDPLRLAAHIGECKGC
jgi:hypothetical protein